METWPDFVTDSEASAAAPADVMNLTGWEKVIFEVEDSPESKVLSPE